jgi:hypothetical protein
MAGNGHEKAERMREGRKKRIAELEAEVAELKGRLDYWSRGYTWDEANEMSKTKDQLQAERDEARRVACELLVRPTWLHVVEKYEAEYPWLKR